MKRLPAYVCAILIFILLGSCSGNAAPKRGTPEAASTDAALPLSAQESVPDEADSGETLPAPEQITIAIRMRVTPEEEDAMRMLAEDFSASNGQGISVVVQNERVAEEQTEQDDQEEEPDGETQEDLAPEDDKTNVPTALLLDEVKSVCATRGLQTLNERMTKDFGSDPDVPLSLRGEAEVGGEQFGVPFDLDGCVYFYNASLYEKYELEPPETWEEWLHAGEVLAENESCAVMVTDSLTDLADLLLREKGSALADGKRAGFSGSAGEETFSFLMEMLNGDCLLLADKGTCRDQFLAGQCAGYIGTGTDLADMFRNPSFAVGAVPVPHPEHADLICAPCSMRVLALYPEDRQVQDAAWEFVRYLTTPSVSARWAVATGHFPVRTAVYLEPEYVSYTETSVAANAAVYARNGYYLPKSYSEDLQYRVREIIGRNMKSNVTGSEIAQILSEEINDSLSGE